MFKSKPVVSVLRLQGAIGVGGRFNRGLDDASIAGLVEKAFAPRRLKAVALAVNSPGGAPTQSALIAGRIRDMADEKGVPVFAFCEDVAASGGYWLACAADEIYAEETSIVGSIGVVSAGFGLNDAIERIGVERRVQTAGESKMRLDPFQPWKEADREWLGGLQSKLHDAFIAYVKARRGPRLESAPQEIFSGEVYLGRDALAHGLIDGVGRLQPVLREKFGPSVRFAPVVQRRGLMARFGLGSAIDAGELGGAIGASAIDALESRSLWARYGL